MGKVFGILLIVLGVWIGMEIFTKGSDEAFGGIFASGGVSAARAPAEPPVQRIRNRVEQSLKAGVARSTSGFGDGSSDETESEEIESEEEVGDDE